MTHLDDYHDLCGFTAGELTAALNRVIEARSLPDEQGRGLLDLLPRRNSWNSRWERSR